VSGFSRYSLDYALQARSKLLLAWILVSATAVKVGCSGQADFSGAKTDAAVNSLELCSELLFTDKGSLFACVRVSDPITTPTSSLQIEQAELISKIVLGVSQMYVPLINLGDRETWLVEWVALSSWDASANLLGYQRVSAKRLLEQGCGSDAVMQLTGRVPIHSQRSQDDCWSLMLDLAKQGNSGDWVWQAIAYECQARLAKSGVGQMPELQSFFAHSPRLAFVFGCGPEAGSDVVPEQGAERKYGEGMGPIPIRRDVSIYPCWSGYESLANIELLWRELDPRNNDSIRRLYQELESLGLVELVRALRMKVPD